MRFEFATAGRIVFGPGTAAEVPGIAASMGHRALVVTGRDPSRAQHVLDGLAEAGLTPTPFAVPGEPTTDLVAQGVATARDAGCELVLAVGGGSAIDAAKAISAMLANPGALMDYLEVIGKGQPLSRPAAPCIAAPTTAGTGAEVTHNAVLACPPHRVKVSLRSPLMLPRVAVVDPELTHSMPPAVTAASGLDALTQLLEVFVSTRANPLTDGLCREGLARAARSLRRAYDDGSDAAAREDMCVASLFGGLALANAKLGAVHGFAGPVGGMFDAPHGAVCARLLPGVMAANIRAMQQRRPDHPAMPRYDEIARIVTGRPAARAADGVAWAGALCEALAVKPLSAYGATTDDVPAVVAKARKAGSMKGNPIELTPEELAVILSEAL